MGWGRVSFRRLSCLLQLLSWKSGGCWAVFKQSFCDQHVLRVTYSPVLLLCGFNLALPSQPCLNFSLLLLPHLHFQQFRLLLDKERAKGGRQ